MKMENKIELFRKYVEECSNNGLIIGQGNPCTDILLVGCEPSGCVSDQVTFCRECLNNQNGRSESDLWDYRDKKSEGWTWNKYQKIINAVYPERVHKVPEKLDFEECAFTTEMNNEPGKHSKDVKKDSIPEKIKLLQESAFIQSFPVVVLGCYKYIRNVGVGEERQIDTTFNVHFVEEREIGKRKFWIHHSNDINNPKLVIHTSTQLSGAISNEYLNAIGETIRKFLAEKC
jgi:hypothetical protein